MSDSLVIFTKAAAMLAEADTLQKAKELKTLALTASEWARRKDMGEEAVQHARSYAWEAERKMGTILLATPKAKGGRPPEKEETRRKSRQVFQTLEEIGVTRDEASQAQKLARMPDEVFEEVKAGKRTREGRPHVSQNSGENEWYTPQEFIDAVREVMGDIDCDPASSKIANKTVKAKTFFTKEDNGLSKKWHGKVFLNPPYAQPLISQFALAVQQNLERDSKISEICILVNNATDTEWGQRLLSICNSICLIKGRVKFIDINGEPSGAPLQGQIMFYCGKKTDKFSRVFGEFGEVFIHE